MVAIKLTAEKKIYRKYFFFLSDNYWSDNSVYVNVNKDDITINIIRNFFINRSNNGTRHLITSHHLRIESRRITRSSPSLIFGGTRFSALRPPVCCYTAILFWTHTLQSSSPFFFAYLLFGRAHHPRDATISGRDSSYVSHARILHTRVNIFCVVPVYTLLFMYIIRSVSRSLRIINSIKLVRKKKKKTRSEDEMRSAWSFTIFPISQHTHRLIVIERNLDLRV